MGKGNWDYRAVRIDLHCGALMQVAEQQQRRLTSGKQAVKESKRQGMETTISLGIANFSQRQSEVRMDI